MHRAYRWVPWLLVLGTAVFLGVIWRGSQPEPEPLYHGQPLKYWADTLRHPDIHKRLRAAQVLGSLGDDARPATPALVLALQDTDPGIRWQAARSLARLGEHTDEAAPVLVQCLAIRLTRLEAAQLLVKIGPDAVPALCQTLDDPRSAIRQPAVEVLRDLGPAAIRAFLHLVVVLGEDPNPQLRREAAIALGRLGNAAAASYLIDRLDDPDERVRQAVAEALVLLGGPALPAIGEAFQAGKSRAALAWVLAHIGPPARNTEPILIPALADPDPQVRQQSARAVVLIGGDVRPCLPILLAALQDRSFRWDALGALVKVGAPAVPAMLPALRDPDEIVRGDVARALGQLGPAAKEAVPALAGALGDDDRSVRREAVAALGRIGADAKIVLPAMIVLCKDADPLNRGEVAIALALLGPAAAPAIPGLVENLADEDENVRQESAKALVAIGPAAIQGLKASLRHENDAIRHAAGELLRRLE